MLNSFSHNRPAAGAARPRGVFARARQRGVVLMVALIVLVALTLAGIALMRSVDTSTLIAGNLAFQQAATNYGDTGVETAIGWLQANNSGSTLHTDIKAQGYVAARGEDPAVGQSWDAYWNAVIVPNAQVVTLTTDTVTGNTVSYTIHRLCNLPGDPISGVDCSLPQSAGNSSAASSKGSGFIQIQVSTAIYYRITARIVGPRNTISYVQAIVSL